MKKYTFKALLICGPIAVGLYFLFFKTSIASKWGIWPGVPSGDIDFHTWCLLILRWFAFNKYAGYYWIALFIYIPFGIAIYDGDKCEKCGSILVEYGDIEVAVQKVKYANKDGGPDLRHKKNVIIARLSRPAKCESCSHQWTDEWIEQKEVLTRDLISSLQTTDI
jgi:hypothetical protein